MAWTSLRNLDLNLLLALDALLKERNVTRAAHRLGLSQPAVSGALARLRRHFGDDLLARVGNRYELTPLAHQLGPRVEVALSGLQRVFDARPDFNPAEADHEVTILASDYTVVTMGDALARAIADEAPRVRLRLHQVDTPAVDAADETLRHVEGVILPHGFLTDVPCVELVEDRWVLVVSADSPLARDGVVLADLATVPWVLTHHLPTAFTPAAHQLRVLGIEPTVQIVVESFAGIPHLIAGSDRVAVLQAGLARRLARAADVVTLECPWPVVPLKLAFWWHPSFRADPAHCWLRALMSRVAAEVATELSAGSSAGP